MTKDKLVVYFRKGKPIFVDRQILKWRRRRRKMLAEAKKEEAKASPEPTMKNIFA